MKKAVIIAILLISILAMSSAYAVWNDSITAEVSVSSAVTKLNYVDRSYTYWIQYTQQGSAVSSSNPYSNIEETAYYLYPTSSSSDYTITYTIENLGTAPVTLQGLDISGLAYGTDAPSNRHTWLLRTLRIDYTLYNANASPQSYTYTMNDVYDHASDGVSFASMSNNIINPGETCTLTVEYYRASNYYVNSYYLHFRETDTLVYTVY